MAAAMKGLGVIVVVVGVLFIAVIQQHLPTSQKLNVILPIIPGIVFVSSIYFALGAILDRLDVITGSLGRPQVSSPRAGPVEPTLAGGRRDGSHSIVSNEPAP